MIHSALESLHDKFIDGLEFCKLVYERFEEVRDQPEGSKILRERQRPEKKLLEELFPICRYIQTYYGPGQYMAVRWVDGSQSFDAKVKTTGAMVEHGEWPAEGTLEVTQAQHPKEHLMRELLNTGSGGFGLDGLRAVKGKPGERGIESAAMSYSNHSCIAQMRDIILKAIDAKAAKMAKGLYPPDTTLIVDCTLTTVFGRDEWDGMVIMVREALPKHGFVSIFATANAGGYTAVL